MVYFQYSLILLMLKCVGVY